MNIKINGFELDGDLMDADFMAAYETATKEMAERAQEIGRRKYESVSEAMLSQCAVVNDYFDAIFGNGTSEKIFDGAEKNLMVHLNAVEELTDWGNSERKKLNDFTNRYTQRQAALNNRQPYHYNSKKRKK